MLTDAQAHAAIEAKDARFDGVFFVGVTSTGIYCRCICSARTPKPQNRRFFPSAAAAEGAGFRPCLLCRPELAPGLSPLEAKHRLASAALREIEAGALEAQSLAQLALRLGVSDRHLRRAVLAVYGASPVNLAQTHRLLLAKRLLRDSDLSITDVAFAAGFQSLRRFNALFQQRYRLSPSRIRAQRGAEAAPGGGALGLRLAARGAFDAAGAAAFLAARAVAGVEQVAGLTYSRALRLAPADKPLALTLRFDAGGVTALCAPEPVSLVRPLLARVAQAFDLFTDVAAVDAHLAQDPLLAPDVAADPGVRLTAGLDAFEIAVRAVIGQQISVAAARTILGRLCALAGDEIAGEAVTRAFPTAEALARQPLAALTGLGLTGRRAQTLLSLAKAAQAPGFLDRADPEGARHRLRGLAGVGPWTANYIALRALGDQDALPAGDVVLQSAAGMTEKELTAAAERWRPYRGYATLRLWRRAARQKRSTP